MDLTKIVQDIQYVLAPAVMISSSALLLLGFQNKFSSLVSRFRALNQEKRLLSQKKEKTPIDQERFLSVTEQVDRLAKRATHVKNAILLAYSAIICFIATSILLFFKIYTSLQLSHLAIASFLLGLAFIFAASILMIVEVTLAFNIVRIEKES